MQTVTAAMKLKTLACWKNSYGKPRQCIKKQGHHLADKVYIVKVTVFLIVMYGCKSWTIKKAECWKIDAFELWCWRRLLKVPCTARRSNQSILRKSTLIFTGRTDAEAEDPILWPPDVKRWFIGKDPDAGKYWGQEQKGATEDVMVGWHHWLKLREIVKDREAWCAAVHGSEQSWTWLSNWTITAENIKYEAEEKILKLSKNSAIIGLRTTYDILKSKIDERLKLCLFTHIAYDWFPA